MSQVTGSSAAEPLEDLLETLKPRFGATMARFGIPPQDAEDLLQQTLLTYLYKQDSVHDPAKWMMGTLRNKCLIYWRKRRRRLYDSVDAALLQSLAEPEGPPQERLDLRSDVNGVLNALPSRCQSLLRLRYRLDYDPAEAADEMGYSRSGIYKVLDRCIAAFTRKMVSTGLAEEPSV